MDSKLIKPRLLFISPVCPSPDGPGLAMRPYYQIVRLSRMYAIHLLVAGPAPAMPVDGDPVKKYCENMDYVCIYRFSGWRLSLWHRYHTLRDRFMCFITGGALRFVPDAGDGRFLRHDKNLARIAKMQFDRVHVFRLYLSPVADALKEYGLNSFYSLDMDDIESETRTSISRLYASNGDAVQATRLRREAEIYSNMETEIIPGYDLIYTCSSRDRDMLQKRFPGKEITVLPNVVPVARAAGKHRANTIFTMLFVGTLGYHPNTDALLFFADRILPALREKSTRPWQLRVVGALPENKWSKQLSNIPEIKFAGWVKDLRREYEMADLVVTPIRGGGGTRIKILEAFACGVPVVSTVKGAEGLEAENGVHLLIEEDPERFAEACIRLMTDRRFAEQMSKQASILAAMKYNPEAISRAWERTLKLPASRT